jgi:hypothetical protein
MMTWAMFKSWKPWRRWKPWYLPFVIVAVLFGAYGLIALLVTGVLETSEFWASEASAAWGQAFFSVGAIAVAILIDRGSARRTLDERREQARRADEEQTRALGQCIRAAGWLREAAEDPYNSRSDLREAMLMLQTWKNTLRYYLGRGGASADLVTSMLFFEAKIEVIESDFASMVAVLTPESRLTFVKSIEQVLADLNGALDEIYFDVPHFLAFRFPEFGHARPRQR